jgi:hypothetical protein
MDGPQAPSRLALWLVLCVAGTVGVLSILPVLSLLPPSVSNSAVSVWTTSHPVPYMVGVVGLAALVGVVTAPRVRLSAPMLEAALTGRSVVDPLHRQVPPGVAGALAGVVALAIVAGSLQPFLPTEFLEAGADFSVSLLPRLLYGGITEEIVLRWGLMSLIVWLPYSLKHQAKGPIPNSYYLTAIVVSALLFGMGHLPTALRFVDVATVPFVLYVVLGNGAFGLVTGYLFWRFGLESAVIAHVSGHLIMALF